MLHAGDIFGRLIDQEIDVFRETARSVRHDGEAADQHVTRTGVVQGATDSDEVFRLGCACVRSNLASGLIILRRPGSGARRRRSRGAVDTSLGRLILDSGANAAPTGKEASTTS